MSAPQPPAFLDCIESNTQGQTNSAMDKNSAVVGGTERGSDISFPLDASEVPKEFDDYPLLEELEPIREHAQPETAHVTQQGLEQMSGWWLCQFFGTKETEDVLFSPTPIIFALETNLLDPGHIRVTGRVYNMTISEVRLDAVNNGIVIKRHSKFYSNFMVPIMVSDVDRLIHELIETVTVVKYRPDDESLVLSNGCVTAVAARNPQGDSYFGSFPPTDADNTLINIALHLMEVDIGNTTSSNAVSEVGTSDYY